MKLELEPETAELVAKFGPVTDFFAIGEEIWRDADPAAAMARLIAAMEG